MEEGRAGGRIRRREGRVEEVGRKKVERRGEDDRGEEERGEERGRVVKG